MLRSRPGIDPRAAQLSERLAALADPVRLRLVSVLSRGECPVGLLAEATDIGQSLVSFHLGALRDAGLIRLERAGRFTYARLDLPSLDRLLEDVVDLATPELRSVSAVSTQRVTQKAVVRLEAFARLLGADRVERVVREEVIRIRRKRKENLLEVVVDHARERLRAVAQAEGRMAKEMPELLFVCVRNAGRSQIAAGLAQAQGSGRVHAWSAGSRPAGEIPGAIVQAMAEVGVDLSDAVPKPLTNDLVRSADVVVTMGCGEDCPRFPGVRYLDWDVADPADRPLAEVCRIRDDLDGRVRDLLSGILAGEGAA